MTAITFNGAKVHSVELVEVENSDENEESFNLDFSPIFFDDNEHYFVLQFKLSITSVDDPEPFKMELEYYGSFTTEQPIDEEFKQSHFPHVNAPAIVYPYLRSFVSTFTLNAGVNTPLLGTINFLRIFQEKEQEVTP